VHELACIVLDADLASHWPDILVATLIALLGYFGSNRFSAMDRRHDKAEEKFDEIDDTLGDHEKRLTRQETVAAERERRASEDRGHN